MSRLFIFIAITCSLSASATKMVSHCAQKIEAKRLDNNVGYKVTIDGKPVLHEHYAATLPSASSDVLKALAQRSPVIFGRPRFVRFAVSTLCPGSRSKEIIEAHVQEYSRDEHRLCFDKQDGDDFYIATELRD